MAGLAATARSMPPRLSRRADQSRNLLAVGTSEPSRIGAQTRRWLKQEVSRRRREKELHDGRPVLYRHAERVDRLAGVEAESISKVRSS